MQMNNQYPNSIYNPQIQPYFQYGNYGGNQYQQQRFEPQQQFQQQMQPVQQSQSTFINGKIVPSVDVINANDVPMDGSVAIFPKQDMWQCDRIKLLRSTLGTCYFLNTHIFKWNLD